MENKITGTVKLIKEIQRFSGTEFYKREFVITTQDKYPQEVALQAHKERTSLMDNMSVGDNVEVSFNVEGREHNDRHYVNLVAWKIENVSGSQEPKVAASEPVVTDNEPDTDLPF